MKTLTTIKNGDRFSMDGTTWLVRGLNKNGKGVYCTESRRSYNRVYFTEEALKKEGYKYEGKVAPKPKAKPAKVVAPKAEKPSRVYCKSKGFEAKADWIKGISKNFVCSYNMSGVRLEVDEETGKVTQSGGFTAFGKARGTQVYTLKDWVECEGDYQIRCKNSKGDSLVFMYDHDTEETILGVVARG